MPKKALPDGKVLKTLKSGEQRVVTPRPPRPGLVTKTFDIPAELYDSVMALSAGSDLRYHDRPFASLVRILLAEAVKAATLPAAAPASGA
jgi:hypothetical protein